MAPLRLTARAALLAAVLAASPPAASHATQVMQLGTRDLAAGSSDIVVGRVESTRSFWNAGRTRIFTEVKVRVSETLKGGSGEVLTLVQFGGEVDGTRLTVEGSPSFKPGEEAVLFVWRNARGEAQVNGLAQGKFDVETDPATGEKTVTRALDGLVLRDPGTMGVVRPGAAPRKVRLADFTREVRRSLEEAGR